MSAWEIIRKIQEDFEKAFEETRKSFNNYYIKILINQINQIIKQKEAK